MARNVFRATAKSLAQGLAVETEARGFKVQLDEPEALGGTDTGMNPVELVLCALGACQTIVAKAFAPKFRIDLEEFWVELEGDLDPDGFMGISDVPKGFTEIRYTMHFRTNASQEHVEKFAAFIEKTCPVGDTLQRPIQLVTAGVVVEH